MKKLNLWFKTTKLYWFISELIKVYSNEDSYFSKKRIESSISFIIGQYGMVWYLIENIKDMTTQDILLWSGVEFAIAGWVVTQIQKEKKADGSVDKTEES